MITFGEQILNERRRLNMSRPQLARALGYKSGNAIRFWELDIQLPKFPDIVLSQINSLMPLPHGIGRFLEPDNGNQN